MPFNKPFIHSLGVGDLVYGINQQRNAWLRSKTNERVGNFCYVIDEFGGTWSEERSKRLAGTLAEEQASFRKYLRTHPKYSRIYPTFRRPPSPPATIADLRTKCKAGLAWNCNNSRKNFAVHFILDGFNMAQVIQKSANVQLPHHDTLVRSVTGSELRLAYRNRHRPEVRETIQFWLNGEPVNPPWMPSHAGWQDWQAYQPKKNGWRFIGRSACPPVTIVNCRKMFCFSRAEVASTTTTGD